MYQHHNRMPSRRPWPALILAWLVVACLAPTTNAQQQQDPLSGMDREQRRIFQAYTRLFCKQFFRFGDNRYVILPNYEISRENSSGRTYAQFKARMTETKIVRRNNLRFEEKIEPPAGEVIAAALVIPAIDVGHFGHINSVTIKEILGPNEMIVEKIVLIPKDQVGKNRNTLRKQLQNRQKQYEKKTYRLLGFDTDGLKPGKTYLGPREKGLHIAVMSTDPQHSFVLVNFEKLDRTRASDFPKVIRYVKLEPVVFIDMVRDNRVRLGSKGDQASLISIYHRFYSRYVPKRLTQGPAIKPEEPEITPEPDNAPPPQPDPDVEPDNPTPKPDQTDPVEPNPDRPGPDNAAPPNDDEDEDDWDYDETESPNAGEPNFFGIPF